VDYFSFAPVAAVLDGAYSVLSALEGILTPLTGSASAPVAIMVITLAVRAALIPVAVAQARADRQRRRLAPLLHELQRLYRANPDLLKRKTAELYAAEKASPIAGCFPTLLQAPVLSTLYGLFVKPTINGHTNALLGAHLFGIPLGASFLHLLAAGPVWPGIAGFAALLAVQAILAVTWRRVALGQAARDATDRNGRSPGPAGLTKALSWLPFLPVVFAALVPLAATVYLTVSAAWTATERAVLRRNLT
jgi:YidC/Oxa1 family membrane protein insertase